MIHQICRQHTPRKAGASSIYRVNCGHGYRQLPRASRSATPPRKHAAPRTAGSFGRRRCEGSVRSHCTALRSDWRGLLRTDDVASRAYGSGYSVLGSAVVARWGVAYRRALTTEAPHRSEGPYRVSTRSIKSFAAQIWNLFPKSLDWRPPTLSPQEAVEVSLNDPSGGDSNSRP